MSKVTVVVEDKMVGVDGLFITVDMQYPSNMWALQWDGSSGHIENTDGTFTPVSQADVDVYVAAYNTALDAAYDDKKANDLSLDADVIARANRNALLLETDWWASSDLTMTQEQTDYRQALRDLPSSGSWNPAMTWIDTDTNRDNHYAELTGVAWPTKPEVI